MVWRNQIVQITGPVSDMSTCQRLMRSFISDAATKLFILLTQGDSFMVLPLVYKNGARFNFELADSVQGFKKLIVSKGTATVSVYWA